MSEPLRVRSGISGAEPADETVIGKVRVDYQRGVGNRQPTRRMCDRASIASNLLMKQSQEPACNPYAACITYITPRTSGMHHVHNIILQMHHLHSYTSHTSRTSHAYLRHVQSHTSYVIHTRSHTSHTSRTSPAYIIYVTSHPLVTLTTHRPHTLQHIRDIYTPAYVYIVPHVHHIHHVHTNKRHASQPYITYATKLP